MADRLAKNPLIPKAEQKAYDGGSPVLREKELKTRLHLKKPARIGVQFMGDLFHPAIRFDSKLQVWLQIEAHPRHQFFILTKRPKEMKNFFDFLFRNPVAESGLRQPFNLWLGVSVEDQKTADERIPILLQIPATHRWISVEPMLGYIILDFRTIREQRAGYHSALDGSPIHWVVAGGETGPNARPMHLDWVRSVRDQCQAAGVPFFFKSWGNAYPNPNFKIDIHILDGKKYHEFPRRD